MKRMLAGSLLASWVAVAHAQEVEWRAVGSPKSAKPAPASTVQTVAASANRGPTELPPVPAPADPSAVAGPMEISSFPGEEQPLPAPQPLTPPPQANDIIAAPGSKKDEPTLGEKGPIMGPPLPAPTPYILPDCPTCSQPIFGSTSSLYCGKQFFVHAESLLWVTRGVNGPVLATTGPIASNGAVNDPRVRTVLDSEDLDTQFRPGLRIGAGWWFDPCETHGIDTTFFFLPRRTGQFAATDRDFPTLFRPFFVLNTGFAGTGGRAGEFSELVFLRPLVQGRFDADLRSVFWGADVNYRHNFWSSGNTKLDGFAGFRYLNLDEKLTMTETIRPQVPVGYGAFTLPAGALLQIRDRFATRNDFYGGQIGANLAYQRDKWTFDLRPAVALGATRQRLSIDGVTTITPAAAAPPGAFNGGLLANSGNIGNYTKDPFTVVPEVTFNVGYQLGDHWKVFTGYNFLYWSNVIRPTDQIDRNMDVTRIPNFLMPGENVAAVPGAHPGVPFKQTDFWAQGANIGLEYRW
ncbi:MAG: BBP7 family outer membrane beta-barrel protein [Gemmataceae bacterium]